MATFALSRDRKVRLLPKVLVPEPEVLTFVEKDEMFSSHDFFTSRGLIRNGKGIKLRKLSPSPFTGIDVFILVRGSGYEPTLSVPFTRGSDHGDGARHFEFDGALPVLAWGLSPHCSITITTRNLVSRPCIYELVLRMYRPLKRWRFTLDWLQNHSQQVAVLVYVPGSHWHWQFLVQIELELYTGHCRFSWDVAYCHAHNKTTAYLTTVGGIEIIPLASKKLGVTRRLSGQ